MLDHSPKILAFAFLGGIIPSLLWLWFWLKEDKKNPEPKGLLAITFLLGMAGVVLVLPIERYIQGAISSQSWQIILWAGAEELMKFTAVLVILLKTKYIDEPIDWPIYLITAALGFAALENALFLIQPLAAGSTTVGLLTGQLRYLGSTLLHTVASGALGIAFGISMRLEEWKKEWHIFVGFTLAIALHSVFNFFIMRNSGSDFLKVFAFLWVVTIIVLLLFEKVRRMN